MDEILIYQGDCLEVMKTLPSESIDSIVTDPPYELGFMGKEWDNTRIANSVELWTECLRVLKSGGYLLAFGGTRTYHKMACAIEDAGFEIRDMIEWVYGSGFPKSLNIGKAVDKLQGNERQVIGIDKSGKSSRAYQSEEKTTAGQYKIDKGTSEWEGWGTALKPAHEPICMARKPLSEKTVAENVLKYRTGGINIDESRVDFVSEEDRKESITKNQHADFGTKPMTNNNVYGDYSMLEPKNFNPTGRFPANLIHDNSEEVKECFPETKSVKANNVQRKDCPNTAMSGRNYARFNEEEGYDDSGNASRFFKSIIYQAKASKSERNKGCEDMEQQITSDGREKSIDNAFQRGETLRHNNHPTVKPVALMEYLINMVTPKCGVVLDPFAGSGSTLVAAKELGFNFIGIEKENEYIKIIQARINNTQFYNETLFQ